LADLLKNKAQPELAANGVLEWIEKERKMRERLMKEKAAREQREKALVRLSIYFPHVIPIHM
jgi:chaperone BCS1